MWIVSRLRTSNELHGDVSFASTPPPARCLLVHRGAAARLTPENVFHCGRDGTRRRAPRGALGRRMPPARRSRSQRARSGMGKRSRGVQESRGLRARDQLALRPLPGFDRPSRSRMHPFSKPLERGSTNPTASPGEKETAQRPRPIRFRRRCPTGQCASAVVAWLRRSPLAESAQSSSPFLRCAYCGASEFWWATPAIASRPRWRCGKLQMSRHSTAPDRT